MTNDQMWRAVLEHYGHAPFENPKTKEIVRPSDKKVEFLYIEMRKFMESIERLQEQKRDAVRRFVNWKFRPRIIK